MACWCEYVNLSIIFSHVYAERPICFLRYSYFYFHCMCVHVVCVHVCMHVSKCAFTYMCECTWCLSGPVKAGGWHCVFFNYSTPYIIWGSSLTDPSWDSKFSLFWLSVLLWGFPVSSSSELRCMILVAYTHLGCTYVLVIQILVLSNAWQACYPLGYLPVPI